MSAKANPDRDAFTFSLGGMAAIKSYAFAPAIADDRINKAWDKRLGTDPVEQPLEDQPNTILELENFLARYFAPGCCREAA